MNTNKVFNLELCREDAERILIALEDYKVKCNQLVEQCKTEEQENVAYLECSYVSELIYYLEGVFDLDLWTITE